MTERRKLTPDIAVVGGGSGGLSIAAGAAMLGLKVVLFEKGEMGGDCLNTGCVPSKALITVARRAQAMRDVERFGLSPAEPTVDWSMVRAHVRNAIETIAPIDSQERFEGLGVTVVREHARFLNPRTLVSESVQVSPRRIVLATGSTAAIPPVDGLFDTPYLTNETIFDLDERPEHLVIIGGGPIGIELGQAFRRLGSAVTVIDVGHMLARADRDQAEQVQDVLRDEGVKLYDHASITRVSGAKGAVKLELNTSDGASVVVNGSHLLVAAGRKPVLDGLDLDKGEVEHSARGVTVRDNLRSASNPRVWAVGDVAGFGQFTHLAGLQASMFVRSALFKASAKMSTQAVPAVTYTQPELAQIGLSPVEAKQKHGDGVSVSEFPFSENDRAIAEGETVGGVKLVIGPNAKILGASVLGEGAGDIIQVIGLAMANGLKARALTSLVSPYPTRAEVAKRAASKHYQPLVFGAMARTLVGLLQRIP